MMQSLCDVYLSEAFHCYGQNRRAETFIQTRRIKCIARILFALVNYIVKGKQDYNLSFVVHSVGQ